MGLIGNISYKIKYPLVGAAVGGATGAVSTDSASGEKLENTLLGAGLGLIPGAGLAINKYNRRIEAFSKYRPILNKMKDEGIKLTRKAPNSEPTPASYLHSWKISKVPGANALQLDSIHNTAIYIGKNNVLKKGVGSYKPGLFNSMTGENINFKSSLLAHEYGHHMSAQKAIGRPLQKSIAGRRLWASLMNNQTRGGFRGMPLGFGPEVKADELAASINGTQFLKNTKKFKEADLNQTIDILSAAYRTYDPNMSLNNVKQSIKKNIR